MPRHSNAIQPVIAASVPMAVPNIPPEIAKTVIMCISAVPRAIAISWGIVHHANQDIQCVMSRSAIIGSLIATTPASCQKPSQHVNAYVMNPPNRIHIGTVSAMVANNAKTIHADAHRVPQYGFNHCNIDATVDIGEPPPPVVDAAHVQKQDTMAYILHLKTL